MEACLAPLTCRLPRSLASHRKPNMFTRSHPRGTPLAGTRIGALALLLCTTAAAGQAPSPASTRVLNLAPILFAAANHAARYVVEEGGLGRLCVLKGAGYFIAPLRLDDSTTIESVSAFIEDRSKESFGMLSLARHTPAKSEVVAMTPVSTGEHRVETLSTDQITDPMIDNRRYSYLLQVVLSGPEVCLAGVQVTYRTP